MLEQTKAKQHIKLIKVPALHKKPAFNEIYVKGNRPLPVYIKHANKVLLKHNTVIIHALTAAINKAVKLAINLMEDYPYLEQQIFTDSVPTLNIKEVEDKGWNEKIERQEIENNGHEQYIVKQRAAIHIVLTKTISKAK